MLEIKDTREFLEFKIADKRGIKKIPLASGLTVEELTAFVDIQKLPEAERGMEVMKWLSILVEKYNNKGDASSFTAQSAGVLIQAWSEASKLGE